MSLNRAYRLRRRQEYGRGRRLGRRLQGDRLTLWIWHPDRPIPQSLPTPSEPRPTVFGVSVSKKYDKRAVVRNRARRCVQAALRQLLPDIQPGWIVIVALRPPAHQCKSAHFLQELKELLSAGRVIVPIDDPNSGRYGN
jgi:ribonuclease P protein component